MDTGIDKISLFYVHHYASKSFERRITADNLCVVLLLDPLCFFEVKPRNGPACLIHTLSYLLEHTKHVYFPPFKILMSLYSVRYLLLTCADVQLA
jgi:hypothetical protein